MLSVSSSLAFPGGSCEFQLAVLLWRTYARSFGPAVSAVYPACSCVVAGCFARVTVLDILVQPVYMPTVLGRKTQLV